MFFVNFLKIFGLFFKFLMMNKINVFKVSEVFKKIILEKKEFVFVFEELEVFFVLGIWCFLYFGKMIIVSFFCFS